MACQDPCKPSPLSGGSRFNITASAGYTYGQRCGGALEGCSDQFQDADGYIPALCNEVCRRDFVSAITIAPVSNLDLPEGEPLDDREDPRCNRALREDARCLNCPPAVYHSKPSPSKRLHCKPFLQEEQCPKRQRPAVSVEYRGPSTKRETSWKPDVSKSAVDDLGGLWAYLKSCDENISSPSTIEVLQALDSPSFDGVLENTRRRAMQLMSEQICLYKQCAALFKNSQLCQNCPAEMDDGSESQDDDDEETL